MEAGNRIIEENIIQTDKKNIEMEDLELTKECGFSSLSPLLSPDNCHRGNLSFCRALCHEGRRIVSLKTLAHLFSVPAVPVPTWNQLCEHHHGR